MLLLSMVIVLAGCTSKGFYEANQVGNRYDCFELPPSEIEECIAKQNKPYEDYEREREEVMKGGSSRDE